MTELLYMNNRIKDIKQWIIKGDHDFGTAKVTYLHIPEYFDTITFHCQQAVEKYLKKDCY
jgi:HEPN domain-containing protein